MSFDSLEYEYQWDHETGKPRVGLLGKAVQVWSGMQPKKTSIAKAAKVFNCSVEEIIDAVEFHPYMEIEGSDDDFDKMYIFHEGE